MLISITQYHSLNQSCFKMFSELFPRSPSKKVAGKSECSAELITKGKYLLRLNWRLIMSFHCLEVCWNEKEMEKALEWG